MSLQQLDLVTCPICSCKIQGKDINHHLDNNCAEDPGPNARNKYSTSTRTLQPSIVSLFTPSGKNTPSGVAESLSAHKLSTQTERTSHARKRSVGDDAYWQFVPEPSKRSKVTVERLQSMAPLAERLRPTTLEEFVGQHHLTGSGSLLMHLLDSGTTGSMVFWGPPGCGKTTLARLLAKRTNAVFKELSATDSGVTDVRVVLEEAKGVLALTGRRTILFLDEIHRFNRAQQDIFLPFLEQGHLHLIGATTENPSFKLTGPLISRCRIFLLQRLTDEDITRIVTQAVLRVSSLASRQTYGSTTVGSDDIPSSQPGETEDTISHPSSSFSSTTTVVSPFPSYPQLTHKVLSSIVSLSSGDARTALSLLELVLSSPYDANPDTVLTSLRQSVSTSYDRTGDSHYDMISALHKSVRGSQGSAALYWLARMLTAGEDPMYIARRMVVCASEDIGLADNNALPLAVATLQACQVIGMPECRINLAHLVTYLAEAPKSTRAYEGYNRAEAAAKSDPTLPVPLPVRNAPTRLMKELEYGHGYCYNPDYIHPVTNDYLPIQLRRNIFLRPVGDMTGKVWDEEALQRWELEENESRPWQGRTSK